MSRRPRKLWGSRAQEAPVMIVDARFGVVALAVRKPLEPVELHGPERPVTVVLPDLQGPAVLVDESLADDVAPLRVQSARVGRDRRRDQEQCRDDEPAHYSNASSLRTV